MLDQLAVTILAIIKLIGLMFTNFAGTAQDPLRESVAIQLYSLSKVPACPWLLSILTLENRWKSVPVPAPDPRLATEQYFQTMTSSIISTRCRLR